MCSSDLLTGVAIALENIVPGELHLLLGKSIENDQKNDPGNPDSEGDGMDAFRVRILLGEIVPLTEVKRLKRTVAGVENHLGAAFKEKS